jgi:beta-galactosidase/beta-glucuronidase
MTIIYLQDWKFSFDLTGNLTGDGAKETSTQEAWQTGYDDGAWKDVVVPHDWAVSFPFSPDHSSGTGYLPGGTAWYRTGFSFQDDMKKKKVFVNFDGVYKNSRVWCNGYYLGFRPSGYSGFRYDISHCLRPGNNVIAVKVSHEDIADSRWYTGSGVYRKVYVEACGLPYIERNSLVVLSEYEGGAAFVRVSGRVVRDKEEEIRIRACLEGGGEFYTTEIGRASCRERV